jgi:DNA-binding transcriptional LysR family regulator
MDLVGACLAFVHVSERGSFTLGAAAARLPQSVASRRVAALEEHLGGRLFDRSSRRAALTPFGRDLLPSAKRLVQLAETMEQNAEQARRSPLRLAVPDTCGTRELAELDTAARRQGIYLDFHRAGPIERTELVRALAVRAALVAVPAGEAVWSVPLGLAEAHQETDEETGDEDDENRDHPSPSSTTIYLEALRIGRSQPAPRIRRIWIQPEDDVPHLRDPLLRSRDALALRPGQVSVAGTLTAAVAEVLSSTDLLLCSPAQARELGLYWHPIGELTPVRGFDVVAGTGDDAQQLRTRLRPAIAACLGAVRR